MSLPEISESNYALAVLHTEARWLRIRIDDPLKHEYKKNSWRRELADVEGAIKKLTPLLNTEKIKDPKE